MAIQPEKTINNDYSILGRVMSNFAISMLPILGPLYNSAMSVKTDIRMEELDNQLKTQQLEIEKLTSFIKTDEGSAFFTQCIQHSLDCYSKNRIKIFVSILKGCYGAQDNFDIQYKTILMQTISEMTDAEFLLLSYIENYCNTIPSTQKNNIDENEFYIVKPDNKHYDDSFNKFLVEQKNGDYLVENEQFFLLRLSNLGIIKANRKVIESYNITPLGIQLLSYIKHTTKA